VLVVFAVWGCTFFELFLIPVYWPFLLIYFFWLVALAAQKHYRHMKVYGYSLGDFNRKTGVKPTNFSEF
jgi:hypothetical protein